MKSVVFNKAGYDPFIDFLKAYAIIFVIVAHNLPVELWKYCAFQVWGGMQVPIFIMIQVFHAYKTETRPRINWRKLFKRIVIPYAIIQIAILLCRLLFSSEASNKVLITSVIGGGYGPGSYYVWIYIQIAVILVWVWPLVVKLTYKQLTWLFLLISVGFEFLFSIINLPDYIYRLLAVRYIFLIPLTMIWINKRVVFNFTNILLSVLSVASVLFFSYSQCNLEPLFYQTNWTSHRWICYFHLPIMLTYILWLVFNKVKDMKCLSLAIKEIASNSYEIYLFQMFVFVVFPQSRLGFIQGSFFRVVMWMILTFLFSIVGGIILKKAINKAYSVISI